MAWADRVSKMSPYLYDTPLFFRDNVNFYGQASVNNYNPFNFTKYGRNRELVPFGAATIPDNYNIFASPAIKLRNQYSSQINQKAFAGRPYGCTGDGCHNIGYCSLNPNVYCILDYTESANKSLVNQRSCGSANGTCVPMWNGNRVASNIPPAFKADNILKNLFLSSYDGYVFATSTGTYISEIGYSNYGSNSYLDTLGGACTDCHITSASNDSNFSSYWRYVLPIINNVRVNDVSVTNNQINVQNPGVYKLSFNTNIDKEQQPMRDLIIDWGDGNIQNLVNQDSRPNADSPHLVYHYYARNGNYRLNIRVTDNWNFYRSWQGGPNIITPPGGGVIVVD